MPDFIGIEEAKKRTGLRLALLKGLPSPWSVAAKAIFDLKKIPYVCVTALPEDPPNALVAWTRQDSYPVAVYEKERPRSGWAEILLLAERLDPMLSLIPANPSDRALFFGLCHEICGEMGLGWCQRVVLVHKRLRADPEDPIASTLGPKYGYSPKGAGAASGRVVEVLHVLSHQLQKSQAAGCRFLMGKDLTALDIYWAAFSNLIVLIPPDQISLAPFVREIFVCDDPRVLDALDPLLLAHRDFIFNEYFRLPLEL